MTFRIQSDGSEFLFGGNGRDECMLWTDSPFMTEGRAFGYHLLEPDKLDLAHGFEKGSSWLRSQDRVRFFAEMFLNKLQEDADLLCYDYFYSFSAEGKTPQGGGQSGFLVGGYNGSIDSSYKPFLTLTLSEAAPSGKGRNVQIIDMRNRKHYETDEKGLLKRHRRKGKFEITSHIEELLEFLQKTPSDSVTIVPTWQRK